MKKAIILLFLVALSHSASAYINIAVKVQYYLNGDNTSELARALVTLGTIQNLTDFEGEATYNYVEDSLLYKQVTVHHPEFTFPSMRLIDFLYEIDDDKMVFTIIGTETPSTVIQTSNIPLVSSKKKTETYVFMRCLARDFQDSLVLLNRKNEYVTAFKGNGMYMNHTAHEIPLEQIESGGKIVCVNTADTLIFGPGSWTQVIPFRKYAPIKRSDAEIAIVLQLLEQQRILKRNHNWEIYAKNRKIEHLEDSIARILDPSRPEIIQEAVEEPVPEDPYFGYPVEEAQHMYQANEFLPKIVELIAAENPKRAGKIVLEVHIDKDGRTRITTLAVSEEHKSIARSISHYLKYPKWKPYRLGGRVERSTQVFEFNILPAKQ